MGCQRCSIGLSQFRLLQNVPCSSATVAKTSYMIKMQHTIQGEGQGSSSKAVGASPTHQLALFETTILVRITSSASLGHHVAGFPFGVSAPGPRRGACCPNSAGDPKQLVDLALYSCDLGLKVDLI